MPEVPQILLLCSPLARTNMPALGLHLLQACCQDAGINTAILYTNFLYSNLIGAELHKRIGMDEHLLMGERVFGPTAFGLPTESNTGQANRFTDRSRVPDHIWCTDTGNRSGVPTVAVPYLEWVEKIDLGNLQTNSRQWLLKMAQQIGAAGIPLVGCSTSLGGLAPAIALLKVIKDRAPKTVTILGGTHCDGTMAEGILELNTGIDYIFSGEGEITFPSTVIDILAGHPPAEKIIYGEAVKNLDRLPLPDFNNYSRQRSRIDRSWTPMNESFVVPFESSRGCWYGYCTFCGLKKSRSSFRSKSPTLLLRQLEQLAVTQKPAVIAMSDPMMPPSYIKEVIPILRDRLPGTRIIYEMRSDISLEQVLALKEAGIIIRPGLESLSGALLELMGKPYSLFSNLALLRFARIAGMDLDWAILLGVPGDREQHYRDMIHLLPLIRHLQPPSQIEPLRLVRYSRYLESPKTYGISGIQPASVYKEILPGIADLDKLAFFFTGHFSSQSRQNPRLMDELWQEFRDWRQAWQTFRSFPVESFLPNLHIIRKSNDRYLLEDTRGLPGLPQRRTLSRHEARQLLVEQPLVEDGDIRWAVDAGLVIFEESRFIPLATASPELILEFQRQSQKKDEK